MRIEGHNEWVESATHHIGFTTAWPPNKKISGGPSGEYLDLDLTSKREKTGGPTYAAVTARSYHPGGRERAVRRRLGEVRQEHRERPDVAVAGERRRGRSHQRRFVLSAVVP